MNSLTSGQRNLWTKEFIQAIRAVVGVRDEATVTLKYVLPGPINKLHKRRCPPLTTVQLTPLKFI